jgi:hypothetical protein
VRMSRWVPPLRCLRDDVDSSCRLRVSSVGLWTS